MPRRGPRKLPHELYSEALDVRLTPALKARLEEYREVNGLPSLAYAVRTLIVRAPVSTAQGTKNVGP